MRFSLFKRTGYKTFTHIPIYYDEGEERVKEAEDRVVADMTDAKDKDFHKTMKGSMRRYAHQHQSAAAYARNENRRSNLRIVVILSFLFAAAYLLWKHTDTFVEAFLNK